MDSPAKTHSGVTALIESHIFERCCSQDETYAQDMIIH